MILDLALIIKGDASGAKQAVEQATASVQALNTESKAAATAMTVANDQAAASARRATEALTGQEAAQRRVQATVANFAGIRPQNDGAGYRQRAADITAYGASMDALRAKYNPLFAAELAHINSLADIDRALKVGAISTSEHAAAIRNATAAYELQRAGLDEVEASALRAKLQLEQFSKMAVAAREQQAGDQAQVRVNQLLGVRDPASMAGSARASASAFLEFPEAAEGAKNIGLAQHEMANLTFQMNDIVMMLASGQSPFMLMMQQGSQVTQIMGQRGLGQIFPALAGALKNLISPTTLLLAGVTAAGYAAYAAYRMVVPEVRELDDIMERHKGLVDRLKQSYVDATDEAKRYSRESQTVLMSRAQSENNALVKRLQEEAQRLVGVEEIGAYYRGTDLGPFGTALKRLNEEAENGAPNLMAFQVAMALIADDASFSDSIRKKAEGLRDLVDELVRGQAEARKFETSEERALRGLRSSQDMSDYGAFLAAQNVEMDRMRASQESNLAGLYARSPEEKAAAARARAASIHQNESAPVRALRIEQAGAEALAGAYHELDEAQRQRLRSLDDTIASAQLDVQLVGKSAAETAQLRMQHELLAQIRAAAADAGVAADEAEIARIKEKAAEYGRLIALQGAREMLQDQGEDIKRMRAEQALLGTSEGLRNRVMAQLDAEQEIRRRGIDTMSSEADQIRTNAAALADFRTELDRQADAWSTVDNAASSAIDSMVDKLSKGDISGALSDIAGDFQKMVLQLAVANPLKNAVTGSNLGTLDDVGGISGIIGRLFGGVDANVSALGGQSVGDMTVTAAIVNINGAGAGGLADNVTRLLKGGNDNNASFGPLGSNSVAEQSWNFFKSKGLADHQVAGILGNIGAESSFNPSAMNPASGAYGIFQHLGSRLTGLGSGSDLARQLDFAWQELQGPESRTLKNLLASTDVRGATGAFAGFERAEGFSWSNPEGIALWEKRLSGANAALDKFGGVTGAAGRSATEFGQGLKAGLGEFGDGLGNLWNKLGTFLQSPTGGGSPWFQGLSSAFGGIGGAFGHMMSISPAATMNIISGSWGAFDVGGPTGGNDPRKVAGLVHEEEYVMDAPVVRAVGVPFLDKFRQAAKSGRSFAVGGYGGGPQHSGGTFGGGPSGVVVNIFDQREAGEPPVERQERVDENGQQHLDLFIRRTTQDEVNRPSAATNRQLRGTYGLSNQVVTR